MGEVKKTIKGTPNKKDLQALDDGNLVQRMRALADEVSRLTVIKDHDVTAEGQALRADNTRKAAHLRAAHSLIVAASRLLEDY